MNEREKTTDRHEVYYDEYEIDLREYLQLLWEGKNLIIALVIVAVLAAGIISQYFIAPTYETEAQFLAPPFTLLSGEKLNKGEYLSFFKNANIEEELIRKFNLNEGSEEFSIKNFEKLVNISTKKDINLVTVKFKSNEPQLTEKILNSWVNLFQKRVINFIEEKNRIYFQDLKTGMNKFKRDYKIALGEWTNFQKKVNIQLLVSQLQNKQQRLISLQEKVANLKTKIKRDKAQLKKVTDQSKNIEQFLVTKEGISEKSLRKLELIIKDKDIINNLTTENEELNPLYNNLQQQKSNLEQQLIAEKSELDSLTAETEQLKKKIVKLQEKVANYREEEDLLQDRLKTSRDNYQNAQQAYSQARQHLNQTNYQINIVNRPILPQSPVSPNKKLNIAIAGVLALMLGVFIVFFKEFMVEEESIVEDC